MQLRGMTPETGTIIGIHRRDQRFLVADVQDTSDFETRRVPVRFATAKEVEHSTVINRVPRSVMEHEMIQKRQTPYGMARVIPTEAVRVEIKLPSRKDVRREIKRLLRSAGMRPA